MTCRDDRKDVGWYFHEINREVDLIF
jgi:hypothetical protein